MGKGLQATLLVLFATVSFAIIKLDPNTSYFGIRLELTPVLLLGSISVIIFSVIALMSLAVSEIKMLQPEIKTMLNTFYNNLYMLCIVVAISIIIIQVYIFVTNVLIDFLLTKMSRELWQLFFTLLFLIVYLKYSKRFKLFKENEKEKKD